jgi:hypothetical protein
LLSLSISKRQVCFAPAAAFAAIVGAHGHEHILDRYDQNECPDEHRQDTEHMKPVERQAVMADKTLAKRLERTRADISEDDTRRTEHQLQIGTLASTCIVSS